MRSGVRPSSDGPWSASTAGPAIAHQEDLMPDLSTAETHDERVARQVLSDIDEIARQVGPTQGLPPGSRKLTQQEEDDIWDTYDEAMVARIPEMQAQGMPDLMIATMVFPKRMQLIQRGRPTLTEQARYAAEMAKRAD
jgi:hypothetical protein